MKHNTYEQIREGLASPNDPLFGGSLAYLTLDSSLSLLKKLLLIKAQKDTERASTFLKLNTIIDSVREDAYEYIEKDGDVFAYMTSHRKESIDSFLIVEARKVAAMIDNINTIKMFVAFLITEIKGSLKNDFIMINSNLATVQENLKGIFKYEVSKIKDTEQKEALEMLILSM